MASFCLPYNTMLKNNIKHTHFGKPVTLEFREPLPRPTLEQIKRMEEAELQVAKLHRCKTSKYYGHKIPQAPALDRTMSESDLDEVITRLRRSTVASTGPSGGSEDRVLREARAKSSKFMGLKKVPASQLNASLDRLRSSTHTSKIRAEKDPQKVIMDINCTISNNDSIPLAKKRKEDYEQYIQDMERD